MAISVKTPVQTQIALPQIVARPKRTVDSEDVRLSRFVRQFCGIILITSVAGAIFLIVSFVVSRGDMNEPAEPLIGIGLLASFAVVGGVTLWLNSYRFYTAARRLFTLGAFGVVAAAYIILGTAVPILLAFMLPIALAIVLLETRDAIGIIIASIGVVVVVYILQDIVKLYQPLPQLDSIGNIASGLASTLVVIPSVSALLLLPFKGQIQVLRAQNQSLVRALTEIETVLGFAAQLKATAEQQATGSTRQAATLTQLRGSSEELSRAATHITQLIAQVSQSAMSAATQSHEIENTTSRAANTSQQGIVAVTQTIEVSREVAALYQQLVVTLTDLNQKNSAMRYVLDNLEMIADDTQLVAVNATIEAAGAGPYGQRFQVVAQEIGKLAAQTSGFSQEVLDIMQEIRTANDAAVAVAQQGFQKTMEMARVAEAAGQVMTELGLVAQQSKLQANHITHVAQSVSALTDVINSATNQQQATTVQVQAALADLSVVAQENATGSRFVATTASRLETASLRLGESLVA